MFGHAGYELLKSHLVRMNQAKSEIDFYKIYVADKNLLKNPPQVNGQLLSTQRMGIRQTVALNLHEIESILVVS